jgi:hypothetical protein
MPLMQSPVLHELPLLTGAPTQSPAALQVCDCRHGLQVVQLSPRCLLAQLPLVSRSGGGVQPPLLSHVPAIGHAAVAAQLVPASPLQLPSFWHVSL